MASHYAESGAPLLSGGGARVETEIEIGCPAQHVFDYATTPALWPKWHPATVEVRNTPSRPLTTGETVLEVIAVAGRRDEALWTVQACAPPQRWEIATDTGKGMAHIVYRITPTATGCRFHRSLAFRSKRWPWRALDSTLVRWMLERQSTRALHNLKQVIERRD